MHVRSYTVLSLLLALSYSTLSLGMDNDHSPEEVAEVAARVQALNQQLVTRSQEDLKSYTPEKVNALTAKTQSLLTQYILSELDQSTGVPATLLAQRLRLIQGEYVVAQEETNTPYVSQQSLGTGPVYIVAYLIYRGGAGALDSKAMLQAFMRGRAKYILADEAGSAFDRHGLFLTQVPAHREGELWYLARGVRFGASHRNLTAVLYSFDGRKLRPIWQQRDLPRGELTITDNGIELKYLDLARYQKATPPYFRTEKLRFTESGLEPQNPQ